MTGETNDTIDLDLQATGTGDTTPIPEIPVELLSNLNGMVTASRLQAIAELTAYGSAAPPVLAQLLSDGSLEVRIAAANALGDVGDRSSIGALTAALQATTRDWGTSGVMYRPDSSQLALGCMGVGSGCWLVIFGVLIAPTVSGSNARQIFFFTASVAAIVIGAIHRSNRPRARFHQAIADALSRIAERCPSRELNAALPALNAMQEDMLHQSGESRGAAARAIIAIRRHGTDDSEPHNLPLAASAPSADHQELPVPAEPFDSRGDAPVIVD